MAATHRWNRSARQAPAVGQRLATHANLLSHYASGLSASIHGHNTGVSELGRGSGGGTRARGSRSASRDEDAAARRQKCGLPKGVAVILKFFAASCLAVHRANSELPATVARQLSVQKTCKSLPMASIDICINRSHSTRIIYVCLGDGNCWHARRTAHSSRRLW
jgi:hypothetical protein